MAEAGKTDIGIDLLNNSLISSYKYFPFKNGTYKKVSQVIICRSRTDHRNTFKSIQTKITMTK